MTFFYCSVIYTAQHQLPVPVIIIFRAVNLKSPFGACLRSLITESVARLLCLIHNERLMFNVGVATNLQTVYVRQLNLSGVRWLLRSPSEFLGLKKELFRLKKTLN